MTKILRALDEHHRKRVTRGLFQEANDRLDLVEQIREERGVLRGSPEHEALLRWSLGSMSYGIEAVERELKTQEATS